MPSALVQPQPIRVAHEAQQVVAEVPPDARFLAEPAMRGHHKSKKRHMRRAGGARELEAQVDVLEHLGAGDDARGQGGRGDHRRVGGVELEEEGQGRGVIAAAVIIVVAVVGHHHRPEPTLRRGRVRKVVEEVADGVVLLPPEHGERALVLEGEAVVDGTCVGVELQELLHRHAQRRAEQVAVLQWVV